MDYFNIEDMERKINNYILEASQAKKALKYLDLIGEKVVLLEFLGTISLYFEKGIRNKDLERQLYKYMLENNVILLHPIDKKSLLTIYTIIFSH